ncbi:SHOCT domain-containing protein [Haloarchaeobius amylolyticus]|uniref:SHOCT domain-containing protein n=1 Tax=Haloarchaeobius amylolyticus TaxID=1198296 RepID=UPI00226D4466|nr:SHOCT domain-containing protein [Haloarchaeobius amylolyticus]
MVLALDTLAAAGPLFVGGIGGPEILVILLVFGLPAVLVLIAAGLGREVLTGANEDSALEALREEYARGEIDREEYEERRDVLVDEGRD